MIARLQQLIVSALLFAASVWVAVWGAGRGQWVLAIAGAVVILFGHALLLAAEFALMSRHGEADYAKRPSSRDLFDAWAGEVAAATRVFGWRQPFRSQRWPDRPAIGAERTRRGVVLVHGFACNRGIWNGWMKQLDALGVPCIAVNLEPPHCSIDDYAQQVEGAIRQLEDTTGQAPVVVAHSMGGLAVRRWWSRSGNGERIRHLLTLGTPHQGTWLARYAFTTNGRQMRRFSPWLRNLERDESPLAYGRVTCFYSQCDNIVFPPSTATLPGADNRVLQGSAHVSMVDHPEPRDALKRALGEA